MVLYPIDDLVHHTLDFSYRITQRLAPGFAWPILDEVLCEVDKFGEYVLCKQSVPPAVRLNLTVDCYGIRAIA